jgi:hypothetical protein
MNYFCIFTYSKFEIILEGVDQLFILYGSPKRKPKS